MVRFLDVEYRHMHLRGQYLFVIEGIGEGQYVVRDFLSDEGKKQHRIGLIVVLGKPVTNDRLVFIATIAGHFFVRIWLRMRFQGFP